MTAAEVARLRLPIPLDTIAGLNAALEAAYGHKLTVRQDGEWLVINREES